MSLLLRRQPCPSKGAQRSLHLFIHSRAAVHLSAPRDSFVFSVLPLLYSLHFSLLPASPHIISSPVSTLFSPYCVFLLVFFFLRYNFSFSSSSFSLFFLSGLYTYSSRFYTVILFFSLVSFLFNFLSFCISLTFMILNPCFYEANVSFFAY